MKRQTFQQAFTALQTAMRELFEAYCDALQFERLISKINKMLKKRS